MEMENQIMNTRTTVVDCIKMTKRKLAMCAAFPLVAVLILLFGFVSDEILGLGGTSIINAIYSAGNYLFYYFIFLPLAFIDLDITPSLVFKIALILTPVWWYLLACTLVFPVNKTRRE